MHRPWHTWTWFILILLVVFPVVGWLTVRVLRLERAELSARAQVHATQEELLRQSRVRLSLWHMDTALAPLLAREALRPYFLYAPFVPKIVTDKTGKKISTQYIRSPLLTQPEHVKLHFQCTLDGKVSSPQNPQGLMCRLAIANGIDQNQINRNGQLLDQLKARVDWRRLLPLLPTEVISNDIAESLPRGPGQSQGAQVSQSGQGKPMQQAAGGNLQIPPQQSQSFNAEVQQRAKLVRNYAQGIGNQQQLAGWDKQLGSSKLTGRERVIRPIWFDNDLLLARRVVVDGQTLIQGCWLDWPQIRDYLLNSVEHILPSAKLVAVQAEPGDEDLEWMMVSLPAKLVVGKPQPTAGLPVVGWITPIQLSLAIAWVFFLLTVVAIGLLLRGVVSLSERRAAFVSAVTHELRTPLTTFRMYSEMLSTGMVPAERQAVYIDTLNQEAERLTHLVDNVLAYARLERGATERRKEEIEIVELLERVKPRLEDRVGEVGHTIQWDVLEALEKVVVETDVRAVEQILFNLVDNGCKYGQSDEKKIEVQVVKGRDSIRLVVRDYGAGITDGQRAKLFRPFSKSADEAADTAPGVGLGLALCRRLARDLGGELTCEPSDVGSCFVLDIGRQRPCTR